MLTSNQILSPSTVCLVEIAPLGLALWRRLSEAIIAGQMRNGQFDSLVHCRFVALFWYNPTTLLIQGNCMP
jgi:hypothetical protein